MAPIESLSFPKKSHRKQVVLPEYSEKLAEFFGIMIGDGGINNDWQANITLNSIADSNYITYVLQLIKELFAIEASFLRNKKRNATRILISSTTIVDFLVNEGLVRGDKIKNGLSIPVWVMEKESYRIACVRGLVDTDGCLYIHTHKVSGKEYRNIGLCFSSYSPALIKQISSIFEEFSIIPHIGNGGRAIYLYKAGAVAKYLDIFCSSNDRIISKYKEWRRLIAV